MTNVKDLYAENKPSQADGLFLKVNDGDDIRLRFLDIPVVFETTFQDGSKATRYAWPVYNFDEGKAQVYEAGKSIYNALNELIQNEEYGDPAEYDVKVKRTGKGMNDTKYTVLPTRTSQELPKDLEVPDVLAIKSSSQFASGVHKLGQPEPTKDVVLDDIDDKPVDLSEIPF